MRTILLSILFAVASNNGYSKIIIVQPEDELNKALNP